MRMTTHTKMAILLLASIIVISLSPMVSASTTEYPITGYPGETITRWKIAFENVGEETAHYVQTTPRGNAESWSSPHMLTFGNVGPGQMSEAKTITIKVPEDAIINQKYDLWYDFIADEGDTGAKIHFIISIVPPPEPNGAPNGETNGQINGDTNGETNGIISSLQTVLIENWFWIFILIIGSILLLSGWAIAKRRKPKI